MEVISLKDTVERIWPRHAHAVPRRLVEEALLRINVVGRALRATSSIKSEEEQKIRWKDTHFSMSLQRSDVDQLDVLLLRALVMGSRNVGAVAVIVLIPWPAGWKMGALVVATWR